MRPTYCSREDVMSALDSKTTSNIDAIDRAIVAASDAIDGAMHRIFYPSRETRYFDYPNYYSRSRTGELWLDDSELLSVETITSGGVEILAGSYFLYPSNGKPYNRLALNRATSASFTSGSTAQRSIVITGVYGYTDAETAAGALTAGMDAVQTTIQVSDSSAIGVGNLIRVGSERLVVTGKSLLDSGQQLQGSLGTQNNAVTVPVEDGSGFHVGEVILIGAERMLILDIAGDDLIVKRAVQGSVLNSHALNDVVYVPRLLTVERGSVGTTAALHSNGAAIYRHTPPGLIQELCLAEAINTLEQQSSGYARVIGSGDNQREAPGRGLNDIRSQAEAVYRRYRTAAI